MRKYFDAGMGRLGTDDRSLDETRLTIGKMNINPSFNYEKMIDIKKIDDQTTKIHTVLTIGRTHKKTKKRKDKKLKYGFREFHNYIYTEEMYKIRVKVPFEQVKVKLKEIADRLEDELGVILEKRFNKEGEK